VSDARIVRIGEKKYVGRIIYAGWNGDDGARPLGGDSGGPLVCSKDSEGRDLLCGVLKGLKSKAKLRYPSLAEHRAWIEEKIEEREKAEQGPNRLKRKPTMRQDPVRNKQRRKTETEDTRLSMAGAIVTGLAAILLAYRRR